MSYLHIRFGRIRPIHVTGTNRGNGISNNRFVGVIRCWEMINV